MSDAKTAKILNVAVTPSHFDLAAAIREGARAGNISELRLRLEVARRFHGRQKIEPEQFFQFGLHRPDLSREDRDAFLGRKPRNSLHMALASRGRRAVSGLMDSKQLTVMLLERASLPTAEIRAVFQPQGLPIWPQLRTRSEVAAFLRDPRNLPVFGKPLNGAKGLGAVSILDHREGDQLLLGDGRSVTIRALADDIAGIYPDGYLFQTLIVPDPQMAALTGPVPASIRLVTLMEAGVPEPLYAALKIPAPGAMVDNLLSGANGFAAIDLSTGRLAQGQAGIYSTEFDLSISPVTGAILAGTELPAFQDALALAVKAHSLLPMHALIGSDITFSDRGMVIIEMNADPNHDFGYQVAHRRGLLNVDFRPRFAAAIAAAGGRRQMKGFHLP